MTKIPNLKAVEDSLEEFCSGIGFNITDLELERSNVDYIYMNEKKDYLSFIFKDSSLISFALISQMGDDITTILSISTTFLDKNVSFEITTQTIEINGRKRTVLYTEEDRDVNSETDIHISKLFEEIIKTF